MRARTIAGAALAGSLALFAWSDARAAKPAAQPAPPAAAKPAADTIAIEHATVYVPVGPPLKDATVVISGGTVRAVGPGAAPANARRIDGRGKVVTAGLIDSLAQTGLVTVDGEDDANDTDPHGGPFEPSFRIRDGYDPRSPVVAISRAGGITSVVLGPQRGLLAGEAALVDLAGDRLATAVARDAAAQVAMMLGWSVDRVSGARGEAWQKLRTALEDARFYSTHKGAYDENRTRPLSLPRADLAALEPVIKGQEPLVLFANRASDIELALKLADDFKLKLVLAGGKEAWLLAPELAARKIPVVIDPWENLPSSFDALHARDDLAALLSRAGVPVVLSTFSSNQSRELSQRGGHAARFGMDHDAVIHAMTDAPAAAFGLKGYGRLEAGAVGNVVVWSGDPIENSTRVEHVIVRGVEQPLESRQTLLLKRYRTLPVVREGAP